MRFTNYLPVCLFLFSSVVFAQNETEASLEVTPFVSYRFGGDFEDKNSDNKFELDEGAGIGLLTAWKYDHNRQGELLLSHNSSEFSDQSDEHELYQSDIDITYLHLGGNIKLSDGVVPFWFSAGIGLTHLSPSSSQFKNETNFSANLGLNTKFIVSENIHLYIGGRVYGTFFDSKSKIFCDNNNCAIYVESNVWVQSELMAGISVAF